MHEPDQHMVKFLVEEFKENWSYVRHIENLRLGHMRIYLIITGAVVSILSFTAKIPEDKLRQDCFDLAQFLIDKYNLILIIGSGIIFLYGFILCVFLSFYKHSYENYVMRNANIRRWFVYRFG